MKDTPLIQVCRRIIGLCKRAGIKRYSSKFSNKVYDDHQKLVLLCLKQKEGVGFKAFIEEELVEMPHVVEYLGLETLPHPDTLNKFQDRIKQTVLNWVLLQSTARTGIKKLFLGQDGTGFKARKTSSYYTFRIEYCQRTNKKKKCKKGRPKKKRRRKKYLYVQIMVELRTQMPFSSLNKQETLRRRQKIYPPC